MDFPAWISDVVAKAKPHSWTSAQRMAVMCDAIAKQAEFPIPGDFVECGVGRGGSAMAMALSLQHVGQTRPLWLFDTYTGMTPATKEDVEMWSGACATDPAVFERVRAVGPLPEVQANMESTGYPLGNINYIVGRVEDTIPHPALQKIAVLRLDTDWYESTKHELEHLYPLLSLGGILIIDDYGYWAGSRKAVDEYFSGSNLNFMYMDDEAIMAVKTK